MLTTTYILLCLGGGIIFAPVIIPIAIVLIGIVGTVITGAMVLALGTAVALGATAIATVKGTGYVLGGIGRSIGSVFKPRQTIYKFA